MAFARLHFKGLLLTALFLLAFGIQPASALVIKAEAIPDRKNIVFSGASSSLTVNWLISRTTPGGPVDLRAAPGRLRVGATIIATTPPRQKIISGNPANITFIETVTVPAIVMRAALEQNNGEFVYERDFADDPPGNTFFVGAALDVNVTGGMGGPLSLAEVTLQFDNNATFSTVRGGAPLRAQARIRSSGSGRMTGVWEISDGGSDTFFRPLRTVFVSLTGQRMITETSPPLPTGSEGRFNVRFRVTDPSGSDIRPVIAYFVTPGGSQAAASYGGLDAPAPAPDAVVGKGTGFRWSAVKGAAAYRLQVLETGGRVAASMLVKGTEASLSDFVLAQLQAPATYQWRVSALNTNGDVIASSAPRTIKVKGR